VGEFTRWCRRPPPHLGAGLTRCSASLAASRADPRETIAGRRGSPWRLIHAARKWSGCWRAYGTSKHNLRLRLQGWCERPGRLDGSNSRRIWYPREGSALADLIAAEQSSKALGGSARTSCTHPRHASPPVTSVGIGKRLVQNLDQSDAGRRRQGPRRRLLQREGSVKRSAHDSSGPHPPQRHTLRRQPQARQAEDFCGFMEAFSAPFLAVAVG